VRLMIETNHEYCVVCRHILDGLPEPTCPECAWSFDPANPATYLTAAQIARRPTRTGYILTAVVLPE
jgi:hypothetical protein